MNLEKVIIQTGELNLAGNFIHPNGTKKTPGVLFIHGGGRLGGKTTHNDWQKALAEVGISSLAFDFPGVGESKQYSFESNTLANRVIQSISALSWLKNKQFVDPNKIAIVATSMGGHVAARVVEQVASIQALILHEPAAYALEAENKPFNQELTQTITPLDSWKSTPVFKILENFSGQIMVTYGAEDQIIRPKAIKDQYSKIARLKGELYVFSGIGHAFLGYHNPTEIEAAQKMYDLSEKFLFRSLKGRSSQTAA